VWRGSNIEMEVILSYLYFDLDVTKIMYMIFQSKMKGFYLYWYIYVLTIVITKQQNNIKQLHDAPFPKKKGCA
jgi:hypothetical protein